MSDQSRAFNCPACGAPMIAEYGTPTMKCTYCNNTVAIPQHLRTAPPSNQPKLGSWGGFNLDAMVGKQMRVPEAIALARQGKLGEAANLYSEITGLDYDDAMKAIIDLAK